MGKLRNAKDISVEEIFHSPEIAEDWEDVDSILSPFNIPDGTGGVNPGDRRAIYYLIRHLRPRSVLEVGTHIGASTVHIAAAQWRNQSEDGGQSELTTVDIRDVNSVSRKPWTEAGMVQSPAQMLETLGFSNAVTFVVSDSLEYLSSSSNKFDFIFLDGDHSEPVVYKEICMATDLLNENGVILLHDFFPDKQPLWSDGSMIDGPFLAVERLRREGKRCRALPLSKLPWPTKLNSNVSSLALFLED